MSLIHFHRVLIALGILFCFGYAAWELQSRGPSLLAFGFILLGAGLSVYLWRLSDILGLNDDTSVDYDEKK